MWPAGWCQLKRQIALAPALPNQRGKGAMSLHPEKHHKINPKQQKTPKKPPPKTITFQALTFMKYPG
jgi:hypothetical protein